MSAITIKTEDELRALFGTVHPLAVVKTRPGFDEYSRKFIDLSPFLVISTADATGRADLSPRGDPPGFVRVIDDHTMLIPDRPGNNRLDTMANIIANPNVGCLFLVPGFGDTLRVNGKAVLTRDPDLLRPSAVKGRVPVIGILVTVEEVFIHCAKAINRSNLWSDEYRQDRSALPSIARIVLSQTSTNGIDEAYAAETDNSVEADYKNGLY